DEGAQGAGAEPAAGAVRELFLDGLEGLAPVLAGGQVERDGEFGGEPAEGAVQVGAADHVLAAVSFQGDQRAVAAGPLGQCLAQRGEQDVVDLGAVGSGAPVQQRVGLPGAERYRPGADRPGRGGGGPGGG